MPLEPISPSDNEIKKVDTSIPTINKKCDYRNKSCTNDGKIIDGIWVCTNHLPHIKQIKK